MTTNRTSRLSRSIGLLSAGVLSAGAAIIFAGTPAYADAVGDSAGSIAAADIGDTACSPGFESSCTGNGGSPEYWCADFLGAIWTQAGVPGADQITPAAGSAYEYGLNNGTLHTDAAYVPVVGDAVVYNSNGAAYADHVAIVTAVGADGSVVTANGDWAGTGDDEATFSSTSSVVSVTLPAGQASVGSTPAAADMTISGYVTPLG